MHTSPKLTALTFFLPILLGACASSSSSPAISAIAISPNPCGVSRTNSVQMTAMATLPNGTKQNVTSAMGISWSSANTNTATANGQGVVVGVNLGVTAITAAYEGATGTLDCTVGP